MGRNRNGRPVVGTAVTRPTVVGFGAFSYWSPIYRTGFGFGYFGYSPWAWGYSSYYGGYSPWYYPYSPYGYYNPYYYGYGYSTYGSYQRDEDDYDRAPAKQDFGSLRIKASPSTAKVYVDGTLMGVVDDFDGLSHHLELEPGAHRLELRAEGYETLAKDVIVTTSTTTVRFSLKKK